MGSMNRKETVNMHTIREGDRVMFVALDNRCRVNKKNAFIAECEFEGFTGFEIPDGEGTPVFSTLDEVRGFYQVRSFGELAAKEFKMGPRHKVHGVFRVVEGEFAGDRVKVHMHDTKWAIEKTTRRFKLMPIGEEI